MKIVLIVLDSFGIGALPDAAAFGDEGADTIGHITDVCGKLRIPNLQKLGYGNIDGNSKGRYIIDNPVGSYGKLAEKSAGKDTTNGHWEMAGLITQEAFKTYPKGFPYEFVEKFENAIGIKTIGNYVASGTEIINILGEEHENTGRPIIYTSADSVLQIAANTEIIPLERLYKICETARKMLVGEFSCGRVIARPYIIKDGKRVRTSDRRDYSVVPPKQTVLDNIKDSGRTVYAIGKIHDIFAGRGISKSIHTISNMDGVDKTIEAIQKDFDGIVFTNLVEFDSEYGHRRDPKGYGRAIEKFDERLPEVIEAMQKKDILMISADHGNDPTAKGTDHTREYIPLVIYSEQYSKSVNIGICETFADIGATIADILNVEKPADGTSFKNKLQ